MFYINPNTGLPCSFETYYLNRARLEANKQRLNKGNFIAGLLLVVMISSLAVVFYAWIQPYL